MPTPTATMRSPLPTDRLDDRTDDTGGTNPRPAVPTSTQRSVPGHPSAPTSSAHNRFGLSPAQITGSALAAMTSALAASTLGVAGTLAGAAVGSLVATVGSAIYTHTLRSAHRRIGSRTPDLGGRSARRTVPPAAVPVASPARPAASGRAPAGRPGRWRGPLTFLAGLLVALGAVTAVELVVGHPLGSSAGSGTTVTRIVSGGTPRARSATTTPHTTTAPQPAATPSPASSPDPTPTGTPTPGPTATSTPTPQPSPASPSPSTSPAPTPTA